MPIGKVPERQKKKSLEGREGRCSGRRRRTTLSPLSVTIPSEARKEISLARKRKSGRLRGKDPLKKRRSFYKIEGEKIPRLETEKERPGRRSARRN